MIPGPDQIIACPKCNGLARYMTLTSGNTFGSRTWTDGKQVAPMLPRPPAVVKCHHCTVCYWLSDAKKIGTIDMWQKPAQPVNPAWGDAREVEEPGEGEYYEAIALGLANNANQERNLRILAWWRGNDASRGSDAELTQAGASASESWRRNLEVLAGLLTEEDVNARLMKAEIFRQLGEFESAVQILNHVHEPALAAVVRQFRSLCDAKDARLKELRFDD